MFRPCPSPQAWMLGGGSLQELRKSLAAQEDVPRCVYVPGLREKLPRASTRSWISLSSSWSTGLASVYQHADPGVKQSSRPWQQACRFDTCKQSKSTGSPGPVATALLRPAPSSRGRPAARRRMAGTCEPFQLNNTAPCLQFTNMDRKRFGVKSDVGGYNQTHFLPPGTSLA